MNAKSILDGAEHGAAFSNRFNKPLLTQTRKDSFLAQRDQIWDAKDYSEDILGRNDHGLASYEISSMHNFPEDSHQEMKEIQH